MFDISPPLVSVRDFGSLNGTYVNDDKIGAREKGQTPDEGAKLNLPVRELRDGDIVRAGPVVLRVAVEGKRVAQRELSAEAQVHEVAGQIDAGIVKGIPERYTPLELLGQGGQGIVLRARDGVSGEECAVKLMLPSVEVSEHQKAVFQREISNLSLLDHPNIVSIRDSGSANGQIYFISEFCRGGSLHDLVARDGALVPEVAVQIIIDVLSGLEHAHNVRVPVDDFGVLKGLVHRDVKPANILLANADEIPPRAKLADFGLSKAFDLAGYSGLTFTNPRGHGTYVFMSRMQFENYKRAKPRVDVWASAATLYWMITGGEYVREFESMKQHSLMKAILNTDPIPIRSRSPWLPKKLAAVIDEALVEQPSGGIVTAAEFSSALRAAL